MSRPHVLYIVWGFPPCRGSGVYRALATANGLVEAGFDVTVLTCTRETFFRYTHADTSLEAAVRPEIEVVRIPFSWPRRDHDIRLWSRERARNPVAWAEEQLEIELAEYPEANYALWRRPLIEAARAVHRRRPVDLTIATANPNVDVEAAHQLHLSHGVPYVLDQRDAWALDVFAETVTDDPRVLALEEAYIHDALECWFVNEPIRDWHAARYPAAAERIFSVSNGYDVDFAPAPRLEPTPAERPLRFGYIGTVTHALPLLEFLQGWSAASADKVLQGATAEIYGYLGFFTRTDRELSQAFDEGAAHGVHFRGPIPKAQVAATYAGFDGLLLLAGAGRYVTSGKVFEYMASALPIVSVHEPTIDASRVLQGYPLWFPARELSAEAVAEALVAAARAAREAGKELREACVEHALRYERSHQFAPRFAALLEAVGGGDDG